HIAKRYGVAVSALRSANGNMDPRRLRVGQLVRVPGASATASAAPAADRFHRVARGENLTVIAKRYGVTVRQIRSWNGINGSRIMPGQRLRVSA
ncbi:MAG: LysM peptidoglycan-binding domain-containing protein, partial [Gemmatimonadetes bacterium]|nr:LysM peptidoglycan-binding domain-containing protein [Gemmatimonadota bacterium]